MGFSAAVREAQKLHQGLLSGEIGGVAIGRRHGVRWDVVAVMVVVNCADFDEQVVEVRREQDNVMRGLSVAVD